MNRVLIVAPDPDLRRSLQFALEADGYEVSVGTQISDRAAFAGPFDCTVLDSHAAIGKVEEVTGFCRDFAPVILLISRAEHPLSSYVFDTLHKPMLGPALSDSVRRAVSLRVTPK